MTSSQWRIFRQTCFRLAGRVSLSVIPHLKDQILTPTHEVISGPSLPTIPKTTKIDNKDRNDEVAQKKHADTTKPTGNGKKATADRDSGKKPRHQRDDPWGIRAQGTPHIVPPKNDAKKPHLGYAHSHLRGGSGFGVAPPRGTSDPPHLRGRPQYK